MVISAAGWVEGPTLAELPRAEKVRLPQAKPYGAYPWLLEGIYETDDRPIAVR